MNELNFGAFNSLYDFFEAFPNEEACIAFLERKRWANRVVSPYDPTSKVYIVAMEGIGARTLARISTCVYVQFLKAQNYLCVSCSWLSIFFVITKVYIHNSVSKRYIRDAENIMVSTP